MPILGGLKFGYMFACQIVTEAGTRMVMLLKHINHMFGRTGACVSVKLSSQERLGRVWI